MWEVILNNILVDLLQAGVVLFLAHWGIRWMDRQNGHRFTELFEIMKENPNALAIYLAGRWLGVCMVVTGFIVV